MKLHRNYPTPEDCPLRSLETNIPSIKPAAAAGAQLPKVPEMIEDGFCRWTSTCCCYLRLLVGMPEPDQSFTVVASPAQC